MGKITLSERRLHKGFHYALSLLITKLKQCVCFSKLKLVLKDLVIFFVYPDDFNICTALQYHFHQHHNISYTVSGLEETVL